MFLLNFIICNCFGASETLLLDVFLVKIAKSKLKMDTFTKDISRLKINEFKYFQNKESFTLMSIIIKIMTFETKKSIYSFFVRL